VKLGASFIIARAALDILGCPGDPPRKPFAPTGENGKRRISEALSRSGLKPRNEGIAE